MKKKLLVCIPAYNEERNIGGVLDAISALPMRDVFDVLVVDDGSEDNTEQICRDKGVMVIRQIVNIGYGAALKTAYKYAVDKRYEYLIQMDADGQHDVCNIGALYDRLTRGGKPDIVIGSRFLEGSVSYKSPLHKKMVVSVINLVIKLTARQKITDPTSGLQGLSRSAFCYYAKFNQFAIDFPDANMVIQMILNGFSVVEIPAVMHPRLSGVGMHAGLYKPFKYIVKMALSILSVYIRESRGRRRKAALRKNAAYAAGDVDRALPLDTEKRGKELAASVSENAANRNIEA